LSQTFHRVGTRAFGTNKERKKKAQKGIETSQIFTSRTSLSLQKGTTCAHSPSTQTGGSGRVVATERAPVLCVSASSAEEPLTSPQHKQHARTPTHTPSLSLSHTHTTGRMRTRTATAVSLALLLAAAALTGGRGVAAEHVEQSDYQQSAAAASIEGRLYAIDSLTSSPAAAAAAAAAAVAALPPRRAGTGTTPGAGGGWNEDQPW
jgi:hypothetical protein